MKKFFILFILAACNQAVYDSIYKAIILDALHAPMTSKMFKVRNNEIEVLRALCKGQKSSYEKGDQYVN